jgi:uncharacterized protein YjbJ (UPF0337 family)
VRLPVGHGKPAAWYGPWNLLTQEELMDDIRKKAIDEQAGGKAENLKGKIKEGAGKLTGDRDLEAEGQADQAEGTVRDKTGKAVRNVKDAADRLSDKLKGD